MTLPYYKTAEYIAEVRAKSVAAMNCDECGAQLAITEGGIICTNAHGPRFFNRGGFDVDDLRRAWPDRIVAHDRPFRSRLAQFSAGMKELASQDGQPDTEGA